jgi:Xaa-Pro aminopeptidase
MKKKEIEKHIIAAKKLEAIKDKAFELIRRNLGKITEYDVQNFIFSEFEKENLVTDEKSQIVAANENTAIVHYFPEKENAKIIKKNSLVLIDIWAKLNEKRAPFADITWIGYCGKNVPKEIETVFKNVINARNFTLSFIERFLKRKEFPRTKDVEIVARNYFRKLNLDKFFLHRIGHSLGFSKCHGKYFHFTEKSNERIKPNIPFTIEPGIYFMNRFGIRSEINCYIAENYELVVTTEVQREIIKV